MLNKREFLQAVIDTTDNDEIVEYAQDAIVKMDKANASRKAKMAEKNAEKEAQRAPIREALVNALTSDFQTAGDLIAATGLEITPQSVSYMFRGLVADGTVIKGKVKADKGTKVGYAIAE